MTAPTRAGVLHLLFVLVLASPPVRAADSLNVRERGRWSLNWVNAVACDSCRSLLFAVIDHRVLAYDVRNPLQPVRLANRIPVPGEDWRPELSCDPARHLLYICPDTLPIEIWDVADPSRPSFVAHLDSARPFWTFALGGQFVYALSLSDTLFAYDVADPAQPLLVGSCAVPIFSDHLSVWRSWAYVAADTMLCVVDVSVPSLPTVVGSCKLRGVNDLFASDGRAYVARGGSLEVYDVSRPTHPEPLGSCYAGCLPVGVVVRGAYAYIADACGSYEGGLSVVDVSDPWNPEMIGDYERYPGSYGLDYLDGYVYLDGDPGVMVLDVSDPTHPRPVAEPCPGITADMCIGVRTDTSLFAYAVGSEFHVLDVRDPARACELGWCELPGDLQAVASSGETACVAAGARGLRIVDARDVEHPVEIDSCVDLGIAVDIAVAGGFAYVADSLGALRVVNLAGSPRSEVGRLTLPGSVRALCLDRGYAFIACGAAGLEIARISDPARPARIGHAGTLGRVDAVCADWPYVFTADDSAHRVSAVDVSDPAHPVAVACAELAEGVADVAVDGRCLYAAVRPGGVVVFDVGQLPRIRRVGAYLPSLFWDAVRRMVVSGGLAYVAEEVRGIGIYEFYGELGLSEIRPPARSARLTVPALARDLLAVDFAGTGRVQLDLFDAAGRRVRRLYEGVACGGERMVFDLHGLPAGVYFVQLRSVCETVFARVVMLGD